LQTALDGKVDENSAITGATKTKITYDAKGLVTAGADATTADIADSTDARYVTDAQLTVIGNTSGTNTGDQDLSGKQDVLVSGTNIKTINSTSLLGSGNIDTPNTTYTAGTGLQLTGTEFSSTITQATRDSLGLDTDDTVTFANLSGTNTGDQTITNSSDATSHTVTLSASGGSVQLIEGSNITLTTGGTGSAGTVTIAATGGGGFTDFDISDGTNTQTIEDGNTLTFTDGNGISAVVGATDTVTLAADINGATDLATPAVGDEILLADVDASNVIRKSDIGTVLDLYNSRTATMTGKTLTNPAYTSQTLTDGATINWDWNSGTVATVTLAGNRTLAAPTNIKIGVIAILLVKQDATGGRTLNFTTNYNVAGNVNPTLTSTANAIDKFYLSSTDGTTVDVDNFIPALS
jgi:hypothetical protein